MIIERRKLLLRKTLLHPHIPLVDDDRENEHYYDTKDAVRTTNSEKKVCIS